MAVIHAHQDQLIAMQTHHTTIISQIQKHLGILPPPKHDMPGPSEPTAPSEEATPAEKTMPHEETTTVEIKTPIQSTQETTSESSSPHDPLITTQKVLFYTFKSLCFKHFCVVIHHLYSNWHVKDLAMTPNHICG